MPTPIRTDNLATLYDQPDMDWSRAEEALARDLPNAATAAFLVTVGADGRPHAAGIGPALCDGEIYITSGLAARKSRNLARDPRCALAVRLEGLDLTLEGRAERVTDDATLTAVAAHYAEGGWPASADLDAKAIAAPHSAQSAGPGPWQLYRFTVEKAVGVATAEPSSASRWTFATPA
ncbi:MAG TPA: pyridoxamine 5'-phosphate oxidase family protein [Baekduia sp.]